MSSPSLQIGTAPLQRQSGTVSGEYLEVGSEKFYRVTNYDQLDPFFMSLVSASDHWFFISSLGGLTAGRRNADHAIFPYETEDKIHDHAGQTGSKTILRIEKEGQHFLWEPFQVSCPPIYDRKRFLYKNLYGNKLIFEERNNDLQLVFRYSWTTSEKFGFVKHSEILNLSSNAVHVTSLDGLKNILPWGISESLQKNYSCLTDAYKQTELEPETGLAIFALSSRPSDSAEPAEALRANIAWSTTLEPANILLSSKQLDRFRRGESLKSESRIVGQRGAYFVEESFTLNPKEEKGWQVVVDADYGPSEITSLKKFWLEREHLANSLRVDVEKSTVSLMGIVAKADGLQETNDVMGSAHHFSNVLFNSMRGGVFESAYRIPIQDLKDFIHSFNREVFAAHETFLDPFEENVELSELLESVKETKDADLLRLVLEYLPISFSRRHGDPSRPWNRFSIDVKNRDGSRKLNYQGNWRDIFQNWEALCRSFPEFVENILSKFVNTTTVDGYNPYRITKEGYEWEVPNPEEPWANIGYWGDHQLIYLLKFLEMSQAFHPGKLRGMLGDCIFVYADLPYEIKPYADLLKDPRKSIRYNQDREAEIEQREKALGFDGKYCTDSSGAMAKANLVEKLLVPLLAKLGNFIPGGGFWMNTQRPEWNDANNALAGYGVSMVTLYYARRYVRFCLDLFEDWGSEDTELNTEMLDWFKSTWHGLEKKQNLVTEDKTSDADRKELLDLLGQAAGDYRAQIYERGFSGQSGKLQTQDLLSFFRLLLKYFDQTIAQNRREDGLYHAYHVMSIYPGGVSLKALSEMLEGQVAVLSSGCLSEEESLSVIKALRKSELYREDQDSYLLYPNKTLPSFLEKNQIPEYLAAQSKLIERLVADQNTELVERDVSGATHFNSSFQNIRDVERALKTLKTKGYEKLVDGEAELISEIFEKVFHHQAFTGRSGTFYGYEGLGCIYWHMVSKLLLAIQECCEDAFSKQHPDAIELAKCYYDVRAGLGFNKTPAEYGAFPTDPYSHTPGYAGAKQPGMTGQVKEEILTRLGELGLFVEKGEIHFNPILLREGEFFSSSNKLKMVNLQGESLGIDLTKGSLAFTFGQVPIVYHKSEQPKIRLTFLDGKTKEIQGNTLKGDESQEIFQRTGKISRVDVFIWPNLKDGDL